MKHIAGAITSSYDLDRYKLSTCFSHLNAGTLTFSSVLSPCGQVVSHRPHRLVMGDPHSAFGKFRGDFLRAWPNSSLGNCVVIYIPSAVSNVSNVPICLKTMTDLLCIDRQLPHLSNSISLGVQQLLYHYRVCSPVPHGDKLTNDMNGSISCRFLPHSGIPRNSM